MSFPALSLILAAFMAWPANIPLFTAPGFSRIAAIPGVRPHPDRPSIGRIDRDSRAPRMDLALVDAELEESDGPDGPRTLPVAFGLGPLELPSLVPSPLNGRRIEGGDKPVWSPRSPRLRC